MRDDFPTILDNEGGWFNGFMGKDTFPFKATIKKVTFKKAISVRLTFKINGKIKKY